MPGPSPFAFKRPSKSSSPSPPSRRSSPASPLRARAVRSNENSCCSASPDQRKEEWAGDAQKNANRATRPQPAPHPPVCRARDGNPPFRRCIGRFSVRRCSCAECRHPAGRYCRHGSTRQVRRDPERRSMSGRVGWTEISGDELVRMLQDAAPMPNPRIPAKHGDASCEFVRVHPVIDA